MYTMSFSDPDCKLFASSSKDGDIRIWDSVLCRCVKILTSHTRSVTALRWGGSGLIYSASQDRTIKVWRAEDVSFVGYHTELVESDRHEN